MSGNQPPDPIGYQNREISGRLTKIRDGLYRDATYYLKKETSKQNGSVREEKRQVKRSNDYARELRRKNERDEFLEAHELNLEDIQLWNGKETWRKNEELIVETKSTRSTNLDDGVITKEGKQEDNKSGRLKDEMACCKEAIESEGLKCADLIVAGYSDEESLKSIQVEKSCCKDRILGWAKEAAKKSKRKTEDTKVVKLVEERNGVAKENVLYNALPMDDGFKLVTQRKVIESCFYFENFPDLTNSEDLKNLFGAFGRIKDLYIPIKRSMLGRRFGFVKYHGSVEVTNLQNIWINSFKVRVNLQRFKKDSKYNNEGLSSVNLKYNSPNRSKGGIQNEQVVNHNGETKIYRSNGELVNNMNDSGRTRSYCDVLRDKGANLKSCWQVKQEENVIKDSEFVIEENETRWLSCSAIGYLKENFLDSDLAQDLEVSLQCTVATLGHKQVLLSFESKYVMEVILQNQRANLGHIFEEVKIWNGEEDRRKRLAWINVDNVPLRGWNISNFKRIAEKFGELIKLDPCTEYKKRLKMARLLIKTSRIMSIDALCDFSIDGKEITISVKEETMEEVQIYTDYAKVLSEQNDDDIIDDSVVEEGKCMTVDEPCTPILSLSMFEEAVQRYPDNSGNISHVDFCNISNQMTAAEALEQKFSELSVALQNGGISSSPINLCNSLVVNRDVAAPMSTVCKGGSIFYGCLQREVVLPLVWNECDEVDLPYGFSTYNRCPVISVRNREDMTLTTFDGLMDHWNNEVNGREGITSLLQVSEGFFLSSFPNPTFNIIDDEEEVHSTLLNSGDLRDDSFNRGEVVKLSLKNWEQLNGDLVLSDFNKREVVELNEPGTYVVESPSSVSELLGDNGNNDKTTSPAFKYGNGPAAQARKKMRKLVLKEVALKKIVKNIKKRKKTRVIIDPNDSSSVSSIPFHEYLLEPIDDTSQSCSNTSSTVDIAAGNLKHINASRMDNNGCAPIVEKGAHEHPVIDGNSEDEGSVVESNKKVEVRVCGEKDEAIEKDILITLAIGKKLGIFIDGDENEILTTLKLQVKNEVARKLQNYEKKGEDFVATD